MAGMLAGVECARRRRIHQGGALSDLAGPAAHSSRRSSFCLYRSGHETHHTTVSSLKRIIQNEELENDKLGGAAREAKRRLDERLRHRRSETKREMEMEERGGARRFRWSKLSWKAKEQEECATCLEGGETMVHLPCTHGFHSGCLLPWLHTNAHCPCCRLEILTTAHGSIPTPHTEHSRSFIS